MFNTVKYFCEEENDPLQRLLVSALKELQNSIVIFNYPPELKWSDNRKGLWRLKYKEIDGLNKETLGAIDGKAGVYAILTARPNQTWHLQYIGQAKSSVTKQRIRSHLVWRNKETKSGKFTGSKFDDVQHALWRGHDVALSFVEIAPESLRHYVEELLIDKMQPAWNLNGTTKNGQQANRRHCSWCSKKVV